MWQAKWYINRVSMPDAAAMLELAIMYSLIGSTSEDKEVGLMENAGNWILDDNAAYAVTILKK